MMKCVPDAVAAILTSSIIEPAGNLGATNARGQHQKNRDDHEKNAKLCRGN
jgi:hypothetical protein